MSRIPVDAWNESARQYDAFEKRRSFYGAVADAMISQLQIKEDSRVLELACGTGACTLKLAKIAQSGRVVALDFSEGMLSVARENAAEAGASNITFVHGDAGDVYRLLAGQKFDFAACNSAFWHFPEPEKVLAGLRMLLTESGEFALSLPSWGDGAGEARETIRAKARDVLLKHGVTADQIDAVSSRRTRERLDLPSLFSKNGFGVREVPFEFSFSQDSRDDWRKLLVFSERGQWTQPFTNLDPETQKAVRDELSEWRKTNFPRNPNVSRWRVYVAGPPAVRLHA